MSPDKLSKESARLHKLWAEVRARTRYYHMHDTKGTHATDWFSWYDSTCTWDSTGDTTVSNWAVLPCGVSGTGTVTTGLDVKTAQTGFNNVTLKVVMDQLNDNLADLAAQRRTIVLTVDEHGRMPLKKGEAFALPDGSVLSVDQDGNYRIDDSQSKITYKKTHVRDFNPYLNASDLLVRFIQYLGTLGVRRGEVATLPLGLFVNWLVLEAAQKDDVPPPDDVPPVPRDRLLVARVRPQCLSCGRYVRRVLAANNFPFCSPSHAEQHFLRLHAA